jgi:hypothetical protein
VAEAAPRTIGRYEIRRELGRGAMGVVFEAWDPLLERVVALKTIQIASATSADELLAFEERFFAEARVAARLTHPGIVTVHDVGRAPETGALFIAFERLEGRTLAELLSAGTPLAWTEALRVAGRVADALHYAHARGVVHRDIKPANVMMLASGQPKILDFGIAKTDTARITLTIGGHSVGTPLYSSPEQALGEVADARSDLFSLGVVVYTLLTGRAAFAADSFTGVLTRVIHEDPAPPSSLVPGLPPGVDQLIRRALAKDPSARYQNGASFAEDVADILDGRPPGHADGRDAGGSAGPAAFDLDAQLAALVEPAPAPLPVGEPPAVLPAEPPDADRAAREPAPGPRSPRLSLRRAATVGVLALVGLAVVAVWLWRTQQPAPGSTGEEGSARANRSAAAASQPSDSPVAPREAAAQAWLQLELESLPRGSRLRVWVDRTLVADLQPHDLAAERPSGAHFARVGAPIPVSPGGHDVELELVRDGKRLGGRLRAEFKPGARRRLRAKVGGLLRKRLVLEWR